MFPSRYSGVNCVLDGGELVLGGSYERLGRIFKSGNWLQYYSSPGFPLEGCRVVWGSCLGVLDILAGISPLWVVATSRVHLFFFLGRVGNWMVL